MSRLSGVGSFTDWIENHFLRSALPYGAPTHRAGHILDLVLTNMEGLLAHVDHVAHSTSEHETTSGSLNYTLWALARNPDKQAKLRAEVLAFQGEPTYDDFQTKFPYLDAVCREG